MYNSSLAIFIISLVLSVNATIHELIVGTFSSKFLYTVEFDDEALTLSLLGNISVPYAGNWIAFNVGFNSMICPSSSIVAEYNAARQKKPLYHSLRPIQ